MQAPAILISAALAAVQLRSAAPIEGYWKNPIGSAIIAIAPCGHDLCGKVVWASTRGEREASKGTPHVIGTTVLTGLRAEQGRWRGALFIPDDNMHVSATLERMSERRLKLTGCGLLGLVCRTQVWTRADAPFPSGG